MLLVLLVLLICSAYLQLELRLNKNIFFMYIYMSQLFPPLATPLANESLARATVHQL